MSTPNYDIPIRGVLSYYSIKEVEGFLDALDHLLLTHFSIHDDDVVKSLEEIQIGNQIILYIHFADHAYKLLMTKPTFLRELQLLDESFSIKL